jgi:hypothetical protein
MHSLACHDPAIKAVMRQRVQERRFHENRFQMFTIHYMHYRSNLTCEAITVDEEGQYNNHKLKDILTQVRVNKSEGLEGSHEM